MSIWLILLIASGIIPLGRAIWANRHTTLIHALAWGVAAWAAWVWLAIAGTATAGYIATSLTTCAGVAVLGARRPGVAAWNAVVAGLLATLLIPLAQDFLTGNSWLQSDVWLAFVFVVLAAGLFNYVQTPLGLGAVGLFVACVFACERVPIFYPFDRKLAIPFVVVSPWISWGLVWWRRRIRTDEATRSWRDFRNRFGLMWTLRVQEQFNLAAKNGELPILMTYNGLIRMDGTPPDERETQAAREILAALLTRFGLS